MALSYTGMASEEVHEAKLPGDGWRPTRGLFPVVPSHERSG